ncbi:Pimeloyl-ACP methyl ester carboxylesterase [Luteibacter sp. UNC138MFCol5.1]|uniref:epoxide hydrolase family protein n=1 Tax=Luteibacter sp. UNC138MFCol5.1 TaxID=1502774 RepID=UPI0008B9C068|nr:epoxide hydrolase family protein [Luteibacter sp. UNC138MFCol5.1]SEO93008.1 Pimeloyl-ACP methyl ester carboxylesterase [Luteibacter sp. UNC138MFCol5.1]
MSSAMSISLRRPWITAVLAAAVAFVPGPAAHAATSTGSPAADPAGNSGDTSIRPFPKYHASDEQLADLKRRIAATRWPSKELVDDATQGVQLATMKKLADYWQHDYDWRKVEARLNALPQFVTTIDGVDIHFIHLKSKNKNALPIIITHGWPGSVIEQMKIAEPLANPTAHGGKASDAFDVVIPSLPGYGFSGKPEAVGWDPQHIARAWTTLMTRLGYKKFVAAGGDWGDAVTEQMAVQAPPGLLAINSNMSATIPDDIAKLLAAGAPAPAGLGPEEQLAYAQLDDFYKHGLGYAQEMTNRPQTLYALEDSPIGLAAWMLDHDIRSYKMIVRVFDGQTEGLSRDDILDNVTLYWLTETAVSSARLYWENKLNFFEPKHITIPVAVSVFPDEIYAAPESWARKAFPNLIHYNRLPKGGHFAAWEQPAFYVTEIRDSFRGVRK